MRSFERSAPATNDISTVAGTYSGTYEGGYGGDGGPAIDATLDNPEGIALDSSGDLFIADTYNDVIREVKATTKDISTFAGTYDSGFGRLRRRWGPGHQRGVKQS